MVRAMALVEIDTSTRQRRSLIVGYFRSVIPSHTHTNEHIEKGRKKKRRVFPSFFPIFPLRVTE